MVDLIAKTPAAGLLPVTHGSVNLPSSAIVGATGAGDAYAAGFLSRLSRGAGIQEAMEGGAALAARVIGTLGSQP